MITDLLNLSILLLFVLKGFKNPFVALTGVIWVDLYKPQLLSQSFLFERPLSLLMTAFFMFVLITNFKKIQRPSSALYIFLVPAFMVWITITTINAKFPAAAWPKHDIAFKTILFAYFIPFALAERKHVELFLWVIMGSLGSYMLTAGAKATLGGGGYGVNLINDHPGMTWNEGSTLAAQAISMLPLLYFCANGSLLTQVHVHFKKILLGFGFCCFMVLIGTQARTGLVALAVLALMTMVYSRHRFKVALLVLFAPLLIYPFLPAEYMDRMTTLSDTKKEGSAQGRIVVWRWTIDFANENPVLGGGFNAYLANAGQLGQYAKFDEVEVEAEHGKAFHNIFIEVLGEHGYVGLLLFVFIVAHTLLISRSMHRDARASPWMRLLGLCVFVSMTVYCVGGMFIGVAFYPWIYYMYGLSVSLRNAYKQELSETNSRPVSSKGG